MEEVAKDGEGVWVFDDENLCYFYKNADGEELYGKLYGKFLPDPAKLWQQKCERAGVSMKSAESNKYKPNDVVYTLWEHYNANIHN